MKSPDPITTSTSAAASATRTPTRTGPKRAVAAGLAGGVLAGAAAGLVLGVPGLTSAAASGASAPAAVIQQADTTDPTDTSAPAETSRAMSGERVRAVLQPLVDAGTITADQADAVTAQLVENQPARRGEGRGERRDEAGAERGGEGRASRAHPSFPGGFGRGVASEALTDLLGIDAQELRTQQRDGSTLAEIATAQGVEPQAVIDELVAELTERTNAAVESGRITQSKADERIAAAEARITDLVNNGRPD